MGRTLGADAHLVLRVILQETLDTAARELFQRHAKSVMVDRVCMETRKRLSGRLHLKHAQTASGELRRVLDAHT